MELTSELRLAARDLVHFYLVFLCVNFLVRIKNLPQCWFGRLGQFARVKFGRFSHMNCVLVALHLWQAHIARASLPVKEALERVTTYLFVGLIVFVIHYYK